jgi:hypothetical protein
MSTEEYEYWVDYYRMESFNATSELIGIKEIQTHETSLRMRYPALQKAYDNYSTLLNMVMYDE